MAGSQCCRTATDVCGPGTEGSLQYLIGLVLRENWRRKFVEEWQSRIFCQAKEAFEDSHVAQLCERFGVLTRDCSHATISPPCSNRHYSNVMPPYFSFWDTSGVAFGFGLGEVCLLLKDFAGVLPSLNLSAAMEQSEQSIQEQRDTVIKDLRVNCPAKPPAVPNCVTCILPATVEDFHLGDGFLRRFGTSVHHEKPHGMWHHVNYVYLCPRRLQQCLRKKMEELEDINKEMDSASVRVAESPLTSVPWSIWPRSRRSWLSGRRRCTRLWLGRWSWSMLKYVDMILLHHFEVNALGFQAESGRCFILSKLDPYDSDPTASVAIWLNHWDWPLNFHGASMEMLCMLLFGFGPVTSGMKEWWLQKCSDAGTGANMALSSANL